MKADPLEAARALGTRVYCPSKGAAYALYYWTLGEELADKIMEARSAGDGAGKAPASSGSSTSRRGRRME